jgi:hypothetical protein
MQNKKHAFDIIFFQLNINKKKEKFNANISAISWREQLQLYVLHLHSPVDSASSL